MPKALSPPPLDPPPPPAQPSDPGVGQPTHRGNEIMLVEIAKLQSDAEYVKLHLSEFRGDMKDVRDRLARLEVNVSHLPSKGFIILVVTTALVIAAGLFTIAPKLQAWANGGSQTSTKQ